MRPCDHCGEAIGSGDETCGACGREQEWAAQLSRRRERLARGDEEFDSAPDPELLREARREIAQSLLAVIVVALVCGVGGWVVAGLPGAVLSAAAGGLFLLALPILSAF